MWSAIRWLVLRIAAIRWFFKMGWLGLLVPIALLLKTIGLPLLAILAVVAIPLLMLLFLFGLPILLVLVFGAMVMGFLGFVLTMGIVAIKFAVFVVLPIWLIWKLGKRIWCWSSKRGDNGDNGGSGGASSSKGGSGTPPGGQSGASTGPESGAADGFDAA